MITRDPTVFHTQDTPSYLIPAIALLRDHRFATFGIPEIIRTPGYPLLLIPGIMIGRMELVAIILQIGISLGTMYLVYHLGDRLFRSRRAALLAAGLYAVEPLSVLYTGKLMTETAFTGLITLSAMLLLDATRSWSRLFLGALAVACAIYIRPIAYYLPFSLAAALAIACFLSRIPARPACLRPLLFLAACFMLIAPWQIRNYRMAGYPGFSAIAEINFYWFHLPALLPERYSAPPPDAGSGELLSLQYIARIHPEFCDSTQGHIADRMRTAAFREIGAHLFRYTWFHMKGMVRTVI
ncbi:MAG: glycosyltransferase family 39 protein, partial [Candidatus Edwardsbacteria bacterium]|nr:glycosyltransferase family 39 protein [Candidatus Edwardsbacteria bacterium]